MFDVIPFSGRSSYDYQYTQCFGFQVKTNESALLIALFDETTTYVETMHLISPASGFCLRMVGGIVPTRNRVGFASPIREWYSIHGFFAPEALPTG